MSNIGSGISQLVGSTITQTCQLTATELDKILDGFVKDIPQHLAAAIVALPTNSTSLDENLDPVVDLLNPVIEYVHKNPWILIPLVVPTLNGWLFIIGIEAAAISADSIAAAIESPIGNVSDDSLLQYLTTNGAGSFARAALTRGPRWRLIAALLAAVGKVLLRLDDGKFAADVSTVLESTWNNTTISCNSGIGSCVPAAAGSLLVTSVAAVCAWIQL